MDILLSEAAIIEGLSSLAIEASDHTHLLTLPVHGSESKSYPIDVRNESVIVSGHMSGHVIIMWSLKSQFINDLENDRHYSSWGKSLTDVSQPRIYPVLESGI